MSVDPNMIEFVRKRRTVPRDELYEDFLDSFYLDGTEADAKLFEEAMRASVVSPGAGVVRKGHAENKGRTGEHGRRYGVEGRDLERATYRFVRLNEAILGPEITVLEAWNRCEVLDHPLAGSLSGTIDVDWIFETPMLIGERDNGKSLDQPLMLAKNPVIPGATLRGLIRSTAEILGFARLTQANLHHRYGVRDFTHPVHVEATEGRSDDIKGGWLEYRPCKDDPDISDQDRPDMSDYVITPCRLHRIRIADLPTRGAEDQAKFRLDWLRMPMRDRYRSLGMAAGSLLDFTAVKSFTPSADGYVRPSARGSFTGVIVVSDRSPSIRIRDRKDEETWLERLRREDAGEGPGKGEQKKREHVFEDVPDAQSRRLSKTEWEQFELINSKPFRHKRTPTGNWEILHEALKNGRIPVFYNDAGNRIEFGLVRLFKRVHRNSVADALPETHRLSSTEFAPDFVEALFGFVHEDLDAHATHNPKSQLAGRIAFGFATCQTARKQYRQGSEIATVMSGPRASFAPFYLKGQEKDWSAESVRMAGRKRYPPRHGAGASEADLKKEFAAIQATDNTRQSEKTLSRMSFLVAEKGAQLRFAGPIKLHNVTEAEAGLIIWSLLLDCSENPAHRHMIGRGRNAGAGQARVEAIRVNLRRKDGSLLSCQWTRGQALGPLADLMHGFQEHARKIVPAWPAVAEVRDLQAVSDPAGWSDPAQRRTLGYLSLAEHRKLRDLVKADVRKSRPQDIPADHVALPARRT